MCFLLIYQYIYLLRKKKVAKPLRWSPLLNREQPCSRSGTEKRIGLIIDLSFHLFRTRVIYATLTTHHAKVYWVKCALLSKHKDPVPGEPQRSLRAGSELVQNGQFSYYTLYFDQNLKHMTCYATWYKYTTINRHLS